MPLNPEHWTFAGPHVCVDYTSRGGRKKFQSNRFNQNLKWKQIKKRWASCLNIIKYSWKWQIRSNELFKAKGLLLSAYEVSKKTLTESVSLRTQ